MPSLLDACGGLLLGLSSDLLAWAVVGLFVAGVALDLAGRRDPARPVLAAAWVVFGLFWLNLVPHFACTQRSVIEGLGSLLAVPGCLYVAALLLDGRETLFVLSRAVAAMGLIYLPFDTLDAFRRPLILAATNQSAWLMSLVGFSPEITEGTVFGYRNMFVFDGVISLRVVLACTGIGSMSIFGGLVAAADAPADRKARALAIAIPVIWWLNLMRIVFIVMAHGQQWFGDASLFLAHTVISQSLAVLALVAVAWLVIREVPELLTVVEDVLYLATRQEFDLRSAVE